MKHVLILGLVLSLGFAALSGVLANGVKGVTVAPLSPRLGETITVKGDLLGPNSLVTVTLAGPKGEIKLGQIKANAEGDFRSSFRLPANVEVGVYVLRVVGRERAETDLTITSGAGAPTANMQPAPTLRVRPLGENLILVGVFAALAGLGSLIARSARHTQTQGRSP